MIRDERLAFRIDEVAELAGISRATIYRLIATGKLRTIKIGRRRLIPAAALHSLTEKGAAYS